MANRKSPLRDRLLSNSPDPIKSSILRESGMGWNTTASATGTGSISSTSSSSSVTPPLRIAKRDSPKRIRSPAVARRSSSSYKHMHSNNLVSKSPFKSQIPTPSTPGSRPAAIAIIFPTSTPTRRVSAEKRPRPNSLHEQGETENARPLSLKRDRKQSKAIEGLLQKEPVTKSPFRTGRTASIDRGKKSPPAVRPRSYPSYVPQSPTVDPPAAAVSTPSQIPPPVRPESGPSPGRSALVSRRMHGPRLSGSGRRERRKTVTFDERCDVLEFDRDETDEEAFENFSEGEDGSFEGYEPDDIKIRAMEAEANDDMDQDEPDSSYESGSVSGEEKKVDVLSALDPNTSITGLVDEIFFSPNGNGDASVASFASTPPRHSSLPVDLEAEDGVPLGRSHHVDRFLMPLRTKVHLAGRGFTLSILTSQPMYPLKDSPLRLLVDPLA